MNSGAIILVIFLASVAVVAVATLGLFRFISLKLGLKQVFDEGVVLTENGLEYLGFALLWKMRASYADVESVAIVPYFRALISGIFYRYGMSALWIWTRPSHQVVVIKLKGRRFYKYILFAPKDASAFVQQLKSRIEPDVPHKR